ncbi:MAG: hypothetical protein HY000_33815 [Planctomycetes bacterium]|nr:hypothetical protein [Planctomycetota bacterium]
MMSYQGHIEKGVVVFDEPVSLPEGTAVFVEPIAEPSQSIADSQIVADCLAAGKQVPLEVIRRVRERADQARRQILATHGVQDIGVDIIREIRGELPER